jgi:hypothetical protein
VSSRARPKVVGARVPHVQVQVLRPGTGRAYKIAAEDSRLYN